MADFKAEELPLIQQYLQETFKNTGFALKMRKTPDSIEVLLNGEFIATIYKDDEDGDISYDFNMAILEEDLPGAVR